MKNKLIALGAAAALSMAVAGIANADSHSETAPSSAASLKTQTNHTAPVHATAHVKTVTGNCASAKEHKKHKGKCGPGYKSHNGKCGSGTCGGKK